MPQTFDTQFSIESFGVVWWDLFSISIYAVIETINQFELKINLVSDALFFDTRLFSI
jgi:hypothetical protein